LLCRKLPTLDSSTGMSYLSASVSSICGQSSTKQNTVTVT
jgi:hypothetical protein